MWHHVSSNISFEITYSVVYFSLVQNYLATYHSATPALEEETVALPSSLRRRPVAFRRCVVPFSNERLCKFQSNLALLVLADLLQVHT